MKPDPLDPGVVAADYVIAALGQKAAVLALEALRAGWLTPDEAKSLEPLAIGIAHLLEMPLPAHR